MLQRYKHSFEYLQMGMLFFYNLYAFEIIVYTITKVFKRYLFIMRRFLYLIILTAIAVGQAQAQERTVENRPYTDLRPFHFGVLIGTHMQDLELVNAGPQMIVNEEGTTTETYISTDQDRWDPGFTVGVLGEFRLSRHFQFRIAPAMYFGTRHLTFLNHSLPDFNGKPTEKYQEIKSAYIASAFDLIFAAPRFNNHRPYIMTGLTPMINLTARDDDYLKLKRYDTFFEIGMGCDFYLPYFKLRPELKFMLGLTNSLDKNHADKLKDKNMLPYTKSVSEAHSKMVVLTFYFE